ncbi:MAG: hypothetical protein QG622_3652 [Actinomycetota bacterium]|nr:hypothetical protein [Actinomycetota bacterium]
MDDFSGTLAVVTGAGSGIGRKLVRQLAVAGASVAACDINPETVAETARIAREGAPAGTLVTAHHCDVADEAQVLAFRDAVLADHAIDHIGLLVNNAGMGAAGSMIHSSRREWDRTFAICWGGVYHCTRAFLPLLVAADDAAIVNVSSINGVWASLGPEMPHTAYSTAKFAVKGFTEALLVDLRVNAPHVKVFLVMPGHVGTDILRNSRAILGVPDTPSDLEMVEGRKIMARMGVPVDTMDDDAVRAVLMGMSDGFRDDAPVSAAQAATTILGAVLAGQWRILIGEDARRIDEIARRDPDNLYVLDPSAFLTPRIK